MKIEELREGSKLTLVLTGNLDTLSAPELQHAAKLGGVEDLAIDMRGVPYMSSAGIRILLMLQKTMDQKGTMHILNVQGPVRDVFQMTGLTTVFAIEKSSGAPRTKTFPAMRSAVELVRTFVKEDTENGDVMVAIDEIVSNIVKYSGARTFSVEKTLLNGRIRLVFSDAGVAFDPLSLCTAHTAAARAEDVSTFGLGIKMVRQTMDVMAYARKDDFNVLTIEKTL